MTSRDHLMPSSVLTRRGPPGYDRGVLHPGCPDGIGTLKSMPTPAPGARTPGRRRPPPGTGARPRAEPAVLPVPSRPCPAPALARRTAGSPGAEQRRSDHRPGPAPAGVPARHTRTRPGVRAVAGPGSAASRTVPPGDSRPVAPRPGPVSTVHFHLPAACCASAAGPHSRSRRPRSSSTRSRSRRRRSTGPPRRGLLDSCASARCRMEQLSHIPRNSTIQKIGFSGRGTVPITLRAG